MPLPKWKDLSPLIRRSKRKRYEMIRTKINILEEDLEALQETPEVPENPEQQGGDNPPAPDNEEELEDEDDDETEE